MERSAESTGGSSLLRGHDRRGRSARAGLSFDTGDDEPRLRLLLRPSGARVRGRIPRRGLARLRSPRAGNRLGAGSPPRDQLRAQPRAAAAALRRRDHSISCSRSRSGLTSPRRRRSTGFTRCGGSSDRGDGSSLPRTALHSIAHASAHGVRAAEQLEEIEHALYRDGFWFTDEFGSEGDHGLRNPEWGTTFLSPEWLLTRTSGSWKVSAFHPGPRPGQPGPLRPRTRSEAWPRPRS